MGIYNVHGGHNFIVLGAKGFLDETTEDRKVTARLIQALRSAGHTVYDCTDNSGRTQGKILSNIVAKCNAHAVDLDISNHLNAGGGTGVEVWCYNEKTKAIAAAICSNISTSLGIPNRGVKYSKSLYVLRKTNSPAVLIECCFVDSKNDSDRWNADKCGDAIASAILGKQISGKDSVETVPVSTPPASIPSAKSSASKTSTSGSATSKSETSKSPAGKSSPRNDWIRRLQKECNAQKFSNQRVDGIPGKNTLAGCPVCKKGAKGNITRLLQEKLNSLGFHSGVVDGIFGSKTKTAVIAFQKKHGLSTDGVVGKNTWKALLYA